MDKKKGIFWTIFIFVVAFLLYATSGYWMWVRGQVLEYGTNKPIEGVYIAAYWSGSFGIVGTHTSCFHVVTTRTNKEGKFFIPPQLFQTGIRIRANLSVPTSAYKPGYRPADMTDEEWREMIQRDLHYLVKDERNPERFEFLKDKASAIVCSGGGESNRSLYNTHMAIYEEAKSLATTEQEKKDQIWILRFAGRDKYSHDGHVRGGFADEINNFVKEMTSEKNNNNLHLSGGL